MAPKGNKNAVGNHGGAPTKYKPEYCQQIIDYFTNAELYEEIKLPHYKDGELSWEDIKRVANKLPTLVQFAKSIKVSYPTLYNWQDKDHKSFHLEFLESYTRAKELQKDFLIQAGLMGVFNARFAIFTAINITKMRNKDERTHGITDALADLIKEVGGKGAGLPIKE